MWVWAAAPAHVLLGRACLDARGHSAAGLSGFSAVAGDDVQVWFRGVGGLRPDVLELGLRAGRRPRVEAYWDGCLMAMV